MDLCDPELNKAKKETEKNQQKNEAETFTMALIWIYSFFIYITSVLFALLDLYIM